jgi:SAM-dependent methyltransferase
VLYRLELVKHRGSLVGLRILELGPGHTLVSGLLYAVHGARSYVAADIYPLAAKDSSPYRSLREHLAERPPLVPFPGLAEARAQALRRFDEVVDLSGPEARFVEERVAWRYPVDASALPFADASFDVVLSNASFEHFADPGKAARECARVLAPGGLGLHQIDMRDHRDFSRPLEFLRFGEEEWQRTWRSYQRMFTNRLRKGDFVRLFEEAGTLVESAVANTKTEVDAALRSRLDARFRDLPPEELEAVSAFFVVRKPA